MAASQPEKLSPANGNPAEVGQPDMAATSSEEEVWDEEKIEQALKLLKEMHIQLRGLRTTLPRLIAPLSAKHPSPAALFEEFAQAGATANKEVIQFRQLMLEEESLKVMQQAKKSRAEIPKGIKPWKVIDHPDWLTRGNP